MATEQYSDGYQEGHQDGWNAAMDSLPAQRKPLTDDLEDPASADCCPYCEALLHPQTPSERKPLTHDELSKLWATHDNWLELCRAIEAAHGIKE